MKAPNKIYVEVCEDGIYAFPEPPFKESVEYIRADLVGQSLQQAQPGLPGIEENGIPGKDFIPVEWVDACEEYDKWKIVKVDQPDFPTTDEQMKEFLATHPKIKVPEKYKNPDWLFKKQEKPEVNLEDEIEKELRLHYNDDQDVYWWNYLKNSFRYFYELGFNARKEE